MSIDIVRISDRPDGVRRRTKCDRCNAIICDEPGNPWDAVGSTLTVANYCKVCAGSSGWKDVDIKDVRCFEKIGPAIGNVSAIERVKIPTNAVPPKEPT